MSEGCWIAVSLLQRRPHLVRADPRSGGEAFLAASDLVADEEHSTARWAAALRAQDKRYPALRHALDRAAKAP